MLDLDGAVCHQMNVLAGLFDRSEREGATQGVSHLVQAAILPSELYDPARQYGILQYLGFLEGLLLIEQAKFIDCHDVLL